MAEYPVFPRFPHQFEDQTTRKMWELNENWANHLRTALYGQDANVNKRKLEVDGVRIQMQKNMMLVQTIWDLFGSRVDLFVWQEVEG